MIRELLGAVVADAGSVERAATVLAVDQGRLTEWVQGILSRGSIEAARSRWLVAAAGDWPGAVAYADLVDLVERGGAVGDNTAATPTIQAVYSVQLDSWSRMESELLAQVLADAGSIRKAARLLDVPRSTLGAWARRGRT